MEDLKPVNGIIAEYNPFHKGHAYQIAKCKQATNVRYTVVAMSGNYVQRGEPAILDKQTRTKMALQCGADLVIELPFVYSCASAGYFAHAGVDLLDKTGVVSHLCFGSECGDLDLLRNIADLLASEPEEFKCDLQKYLRSGDTFPLARMKAIKNSMQENFILKEPNDILGTEYLQALKEISSSIQPFTISRKGSTYHSKDANADLPSATAIRTLLHSRKYKEALACLPEKIQKMDPVLFDHEPVVTMNDFSAIFSYLLFCLGGNHSPTDILDFSVDLWNRCLNQKNQFTSLDTFIMDLKCKNCTYTSISRSILHWILDIKEKDFLHLYQGICNPYIRILGFRKESSALLRLLKDHAKVPIVTKLADYPQILKDSPEGLKLMRQSIQSDELYHSIQNISGIKKEISELSRPVVIV